MPLSHVNGHDMYFADTGGDDRPAVLLGHGFFLDHTMFTAQAEALSARGYRVVTWDARGHGDSPAGDSPFTYWDMANDLIGLMDHLGIQRAVVGGLSQGGFTALRTALIAPNRVTGLLLLDTEAHPLSDEDRRGYTALFGELAEQGSVDELLVPLSQQIIGDHPQAAHWRQRWKTRPLPLGSPARCLFERDDITTRVGEITCPTLLIRGSKDASIPRERMEFLATAIPQASPLQEVDGAAHAPPVTHPEESTSLLLSFLDSLDHW
ncbi:Pimeloyl-ACP methyl ester carboxylesterase [Actinopolyspora xinjiangensis]|uniref:Pimeloyl-ACP methyl ester carboxylesterase n=1 Tax=Actinopolyspora xinjiangensis TaxID=405564 RepID=A0A1H0QEG3_9ACTN|nr:alpha/beta fold hydrolase [Actinopolyspora xinjiangensis]SDP15732.1 Pimeloyl-ACP methyl ester carboxylesterase [Actinopolyspora xinjiangensis]